MRTALTCLVFSFTVLLQGQSPYRPFPSTGAGWSVASEGPHSYCNPIEWFYTTVTFTLGDTATVNGHVCHELWRSEYGSWAALGPPAGGTCPGGGLIEIPNMLYDHIWQDTLARKVYLGTDTTQLLYDFSIGLGTYPQTVSNILYPDLKVVALDSMLLNDGYHRTWVQGFDYGAGVQDSAFCTVIEGIGSTWGPLPIVGLSPPFEFGNTLICFLDGITVYPYGATACELAMSASAAEEDEPITAGPSPTTGRIELRGTLPAQGRYQVHDLSGRVVVEATLNGSVLDLASLPAALYAMRVMDDHGRVVARIRIVKE